MNFAIIYRWRDGMTLQESRHVRDVFIAWKPPEGLTILGHHHFARGGGVVIVDAATGGALHEALAPFSPMVQFTIEPLVNAIEATVTSLNTQEWVSSLSEVASDSDGSV